MTNPCWITDRTNLSSVIEAKVDRKACRHYPTGPALRNVWGKESKALSALVDPTERAPSLAALSPGEVGAPAASALWRAWDWAGNRDRGLQETRSRLIGSLPIRTFIDKDLNGAAPEKVRTPVRDRLAYLVRIPDGKTHGLQSHGAPLP